MNILLNNKTINKLTKLTVDSNNPKIELNYLYFDCDNKKVVCTDTKQLLLIDLDLGYNEDKYIPIKDCKKEILFSDSVGKNYPEYQRLIPQRYKKEFNSISQMFQYDGLNMNNNTKTLDYTNEKLMKILTEFNSNKDIEYIRYFVSESLYYFTFKIDGFGCKLITMPITEEV